MAVTPKCAAADYAPIKIRNCAIVQYVTKGTAYDLVSNEVMVLVKPKALIRTEPGVTALSGSLGLRDEIMHLGVFSSWLRSGSVYTHSRFGSLGLSLQPGRVTTDLTLGFANTATTAGIARSSHAPGNATIAGGSGLVAADQATAEKPAITGALAMLGSSTVMTEPGSTNSGFEAGTMVLDVGPGLSLAQAASGSARVSGSAGELSRTHELGGRGFGVAAGEFMSRLRQGSLQVQQQAGLSSVVVVKDHGVLLVSKEADQYVVEDGGTLRYVIRCRNVGKAGVSSAEIMETLPAALKFIAVSSNIHQIEVAANSWDDTTMVTVRLPITLDVGDEWIVTLETRVRIPILKPPEAPIRETRTASVASAPVPVAETPMGADTRISLNLDFKDTTLSQVLRRIADRANVPIQYTGTNDPAIRSFTLVGVDLSLALNILAKNSGYRVTRSATGYVIGP